jgi:hypothetical protein
MRNWSIVLRITITSCVVDLLTVNMDISGLESDVKSINETITESKRNRETNAVNIGTMSTNIESIQI